MTERTINNYINRKFAYLFVILTLVVILSVIFFIRGYIQTRISEYIYDLTIESINSSIFQFDESMGFIENSYDQLASSLILDFKEQLELQPEILSLNNHHYFEDSFSKILEDYQSELSILGISEQANLETVFYIFNEDGDILFSNNIQAIESLLTEKQLLFDSLNDGLALESFSYNNISNLFVKNAYIKLSDEYYLGLSLPIDRGLFDSILNRLDELEDNFDFIKNIQGFQNSFAEVDAESDPATPLVSLVNDSILIENDDNYSYTYYAAWNAASLDDEYFNSDLSYVQIDIDISDEMVPLNRALTFFISLVLFLAIIAVFLINRRLVSKISEPFAYLAENMSKLGSRDLASVDQNLERTDLKEINMLLASYQEMTSELSSSFEELQAINDELEDSYKESSMLAGNLNNLIQMASKLSDAVFDDKENFLIELFYVAENLIPEVDYGTVLLVENQQVKWLEAIGHDLEKIDKMDINLDNLKKMENFVYVSDVEKVKGNHTYQTFFDELVEKKRPIKSSLCVQLHVGDTLAGMLNYDIAKSSEGNFSKQSIETIKAFANLASAFLTIQSYKHIHERFQREIILAIINILEIHDSYTKGHSENVARISALLAKEMGFSKEDIKNIEWAGLVHDIGKILIKKEILNKPGILSAEEYKEIKKHTIWGYEVLISSEELREIAVSVRHHHERWDGEGYPDALQGEQIPLFSRIITLADAWDTMRSDRVYRKKLSREIAIREIEENSGKQFDPQVVKVAIKLIEEGKLK
ncbi:MAG: HD domain-containing phosphohydrolase [bacterium]